MRNGRGLTSLLRESPTRRIAFLVLPTTNLLTIAGPIDVFTLASDVLQQSGRRTTPAYNIELLSSDDSPVPTASGISLTGAKAWKKASRPIDTLLITTSAIRSHMPFDSELLRWVQVASKHVRRLGSVCAGAFVLAASGLLDGRRATTHWSAAGRLAQMYPKVRVDGERIYTRDGHIWTSAGVSAGADLALAMLEEDHGHELALAVARRMVLFLRRPGGQSQFSSQLAAQAAEHHPIRELIAWIVDNLNGDLSVPTLARRAGMSERNFGRIFQKEIGLTPARYVAQQRLETARRMLEETGEKVETIALSAGFGDGEALRRSLQSRLRISPALYRKRFGADENRRIPR
ncbi:MAG TPA: GlxA family transcriptional regulator [Terriglobales bacterium]|nr:GlxA family transcriptional regulator [Terriglobales bacterium]